MEVTIYAQKDKVLEMTVFVLNDKVMEITIYTGKDGHRDDYVQSCMY